MRKESLVSRDDIARFGCGSDPSKIWMVVRSNTHGAKSSIAESTAAGSGQSKDKGYDGGANHVFRCLLAFAIGL